MRAILLLSTLFLLTNAFGHRGEFAAINFNGTKENKNNTTLQFSFENVNEKALSDVKIELVVNDVTIDSISLDLVFATTKFTDLQFVYPSNLFSLEEDKVQIEVTELFGHRDDWGGWDNPIATKQVNTLFSEFYADAPWRMKKLDDQGAEQGIPVHFFLHDADLTPGGMWIDYINIQLKNATDNNFGSVLTFDQLTQNDFHAMFSCLSEYDGDLDIKEFELNSFSSSASKSIDFDVNSDLFGDYVNVGSTYWYFTFTVPASELVGLNDIVDILVTINYANPTVSDNQIGLRVFRSLEDIPSLNNWYRGDTHLHSMYTQNDAEIGLPLCATKAAAELIGLDWITTTDHTSDFDNYGSTISNNWNRIKSEASALNALDSNLVFIAGQEVAAMNGNSDLVHMLAYPNKNAPYNMPFLGDGDGDLITTSITVASALANIEMFNGFAYAAHPFATGDKLPTIPVDGGIWNIGSNLFPVNGSTYPLNGGDIICNEPSEASDVLTSNVDELIIASLKGAQIWNGRNSLSATGDPNDPWDVQNDGGVFSQYDTTSLEFHFKRFRQGQEIVNHINQLGLEMKNNFDGAKNWQMYYAAGSDAHGSFNYSNTDDFAGAGSISTNAVGKLNTVVYCPDGMTSDGGSILKALESGNSTMSDGPLLTIGVSMDGDDNTSELLMGNYDSLAFLSPDNYYLNLDYVTTQEFGVVEDLRIYLGTEQGENVWIPTFNTAFSPQSVSYKLSDVIDSLIGVGNTPLDEYMYIRAELRTYRDYSTQQSEYKTQYDYFHSITNPIWFRYQNTGLSLNENQSNYSINPNPTLGKVYVEFINSDTHKVELYDAAGKLLLEEKSESNLLEIDLSKQSRGTYFIHITTDGERKVERIVKQ